jgi:hypothetical protein
MLCIVTLGTPILSVKKMVKVVHWDVIEVVLKFGLKQLSTSWLSTMVKVTVRGFGIHRYICTIIVRSSSCFRHHGVPPTYVRTLEIGKCQHNLHFHHGYQTLTNQ